MRALDIEPLRMSGSYLNWWLRHLPELTVVRQQIAQASATIEAAIGYWHWFQFSHWATKYIGKETRFNIAVEQLAEMLDDGPGVDDPLVSALRTAVTAVDIPIRREESFDPNYTIYGSITHLHSLLEELEAKVVATLASVIDSRTVVN